MEVYDKYTSESHINKVTNLILQGWDHPEKDIKKIVTYFGGSFDIVDEYLDAVEGEDPTSDYAWDLWCHFANIQHEIGHNPF